MGVLFDETSKNITFTGTPGVGGATKRNLRIVLDISAPSNTNNTFFIEGASEFLGFYLNHRGVFDAGKFEFQINFSGANGIWHTTNDVLVNGYNEIYITYDGGSTSNDPVFYHNGVSVAITERVTPTGTIDTDSSVDVVIGTPSTLSPKGSVLAVNYITGRIVSADEVLTAYQSRLAVPNYNGLVFAPNLVGAKGIQTFDGATLSGSNTMIDNISGAVGTPSGNPVGAADTYLTYEG